MKKLAALLLAVLVVFSMAACGGKSGVDASDGISPTECYNAVIHAKSADEMNKYLSTNNADMYFSRVQNLFAGVKCEASTEYAGKYGDYEVYYVTVRDLSNKMGSISNFELFKKEGENYYLALDDAVISEVNQKCKCPTCNATGTALSGGTACAICAGTGVQYYPNAYFDAATGLWQGETRACSGCAGAGYMGGSAKTCTTCKGRKYVFN